MTSKSKLKVCMTTGKIHDILLTERPRRSGLYQWPNCFKKSESNLYNKARDYEKFDVVMVNICAGDVALVPPLVERFKNSDTKVVVCNDYAIELYSWFPQHMWDVVNSIKGADMYFGTEPMSANMLASILPKGSPVYTMPHPADTVELKSRAKKIRKNEKYAQQDLTGVFYHRYDNQTITPWAVTKDLPYQSVLLGYMSGEKGDKNNWKTTNMFDRLVAYGGHDEHYKALAQTRIGYDPTQFHTWGRSVVEAACLKMPCIGSDRTYSMKALYPEYAHNPSDVKAIKQDLVNFIANPDLRVDAAERAYGQVDMYSLENAAKKFTVALEDATKNG